MAYEVLVVEDDEAIALLIHTLLTRNGIAIDTAIDGKSAIELLGTKHYSAVVLDLMIPGVSGFDVIDYVKANGITTPIAVVSAVSQRAMRDLDPDVVKAVVAKPFDVDKFVEVVRELCEQRETPRPA
jgi:DNA-binding response OmpR family regulator